MGLESTIGLSNGVQVCDKGHHHLSTSWTVYVVDPDTAHNAKSYAKALYPIEVFDTQEQAKQLYSLAAFSPPNGPPSWSMVVPGGAIAVFRGGKFGFPTVKPEWEDPAAQNGGELRFVFAQGVNPLEYVDMIFGELINWMVEHPLYDGASVLGLFVKNVITTDGKMDASNNMAIQFRLWVSEAETGVVWRIARSMAGVIGQTGVRGCMTYRSLGELIERSMLQGQGARSEGRSDENDGVRRISMRLAVPMVAPVNGQNAKVPYSERR